MKKRIALILASLILMLSILEGSTLSFAEVPDECDFSIMGILTGISYEPADITEWQAMALSHYSPKMDLTPVGQEILKRAESDNSAATATKIKYALALLACGDFDNSYIHELSSVWYSDKCGIMDLIFGMHLMNCGFMANVDYSEVYQSMLAFHRQDGGFSLFGDYGDVDVTAMTLQALAASPLPENEDTASVISAALDFLSSRQQADGDYMSYGIANPESTAQVLMALTALGIDPLTDTRFIKEDDLLHGLIKYRLEDGTFSHKYGGESNALATTQALCALVALQGFQNGRQFFYVWTKKAGETTPTAAVPTIPEASPAATITVSPTSTPTITPQVISPGGSGSSFFTDHGLPLIIASCIAAIILLLLLILRKVSRKNLLFLAIVWVILLIAASFIKISLPEKNEDPNGNSSIILAGPDTENQTSIGAVRFSVNCSTIAGQNDYTPENGQIIPEITVEITEGATVFQVLSAVCKYYNINCDAKTTGTVYVQGINNIYERDFGNLSGWMYFVNGTAPNVDCGSYKLQPGDLIEWKYTTNLGDDLK